MTSPWWIRVGYFWWLSYPSCAWKWLPGLAAPPPSQGSRWGWPACSSLCPPSCPFWRLEWHWLSSSLWAILPIAMIIQRFLRVASQWHQPALSADMDASHQGPWTYVCPVRLSIPWPDHLPPRVHLQCSKLSPLLSGALNFQSLVLLVKAEATKAFSTADFSMSCVTSSPAPCRSRPIFSLVFLLPVTYLEKPFMWSLTSLARFNSMRTSAFLTVSLHAQIGFLYSFQATWPCFHCQYISFLCLSFSRSSLFIFVHASPPGIFAWLPVHWDRLLLSLEEVILEPGTVAICNPYNQCWEKDLLRKLIWTVLGI